MSKCMVAYIDWYHERMDGEGGREKIKVDIKDGWSGSRVLPRVKKLPTSPTIWIANLDG